MDHGRPRPLTPNSPLSRRRALGLLAALAAVFLVLGLIEASDDAPTFDEPVTLASGLTALTRHDLRLNQEHPPLAKAVAALPALLAHPEIPSGDAWRDADDRAYVQDFLLANSEAGTLRRTLFLSRLVPLATAVLVGFALYALGTRLFGRLAGTVAGACWLTLPPVLGFGHLNGLDIPFTLATVLAVLATDRFAERPTAGRAVAVGLAVGACLLTRTSGLIVLGVVLLAVLLVGRREPRRALLAVGLVGLVAWGALWAGYRVLAPGGGATGPLPAEYAAGLGQQELFGQGGERSFVLGDYDTQADWDYWPASLAVKLPVTTLALLGLGVVALWRLRADDERLRVALAASVAVALAAGTVIGARPIGMRYLLPSVALGLVVAAAGVELVIRHRRRLLIVGAALGAQLALLVSSAPHSLAWTAIPADAPWQLASDSNLEWGQDFYLLASWSRDRHVWLAWSGPMGAISLPGTRSLLSAEPERITGWVAVSATTLTVYAHDELAWLRAYCPVGDLGGTVLLYRFETPPTSWGGPETPAAECEGDLSVRVG